MKKKYQKPMFMVEYYTLTQSIAACSGMKISFADPACVLNDSDSTPLMKDWANVGGFVSTTVSGNASCALDLSGYIDGTGEDMICYFTSVNTAFIS